MKPSPSKPTASNVITIIDGTIRNLARATSQRGPALLKADVKEIVALTLIDARRSVSRYALCEIFRNFFLTICGQQQGISAASLHKNAGTLALESFLAPMQRLHSE
jgi:hypothetical protein